MSGNYDSQKGRPRWSDRKRLEPPGWYCCRRLMRTGDLAGGEQLWIRPACGTSIVTQDAELLRTLHPAADRQHGEAGHQAHLSLAPSL